jgi:hypothetical protein
MPDSEWDRLDKMTGGPAFGHGNPNDGGAPGMSIRDWFAGQALAGLFASGPHDCDEHGLAHDAYLHADAMLKARREGGDHE